MKKYILLWMICLLSFSCSGQKKETEQADKKERKGNWKVDKEFDKFGNLIRYDSVYTWSSDKMFNNLSSNDRDSLIQSYKSRFFTDFSKFNNNRFEDVFSKDSIFIKRFFNDDFFGSNFGKDFMDIDKIRQQMIVRQKKFLEKYQLKLIDPKDEN